MNNRFFKLVCSTAALLAMGSQAYAQSSKNIGKDACVAPWQQGVDEFPAMPVASPNPVAAIMTKGWDVFFDMSFIYWHSDQEYMELAKSNTTTGAASRPSTHVASTDFQYKPGFKAGLGFGTGYDGWVGTVDYTWLHQTTRTSYNLAPADTAGTAAWTNNSWFTIPANTQQASALGGKWKLHMDMLDVSLSRPYYQGRDLAILPYAGLRGLWLRQSNQVSMYYASGTPAAVSQNTSHSWAVGPNIGLNTNWLLGYGFRFEGSGGTSLLYTRYTRVAHTEHNTDTAATATSVGAITQYGTVRSTLDAGLGLGWGSYFYNQGYHVDLVAKYDFMVAFQQNMMRYNTSLINASTLAPSPIGDLHLHGLTVAARLDF